MQHRDAPDHMEAIVIHKYGGPEVLCHIDNYPIPSINDDEILVNMYCASGNVIDTKYRAGLMSRFVRIKFPCILGRDGLDIQFHILMINR